MKKPRSPQGGKLCRAAALGIAGAVLAAGPGTVAAGTVDRAAVLKQKAVTAGGISSTVSYDSDLSGTGAGSASSRDNWEEQSIIDRWDIDPGDLPSEEQAEIPAVPGELEYYFREAVAGAVEEYHGSAPPESDLQKYSFRADVLREAVRDKALTVLAAEKARLLSSIDSSVQSIRGEAVTKLASGIRELTSEGSLSGKPTGMQIIIGAGSGSDTENNTENTKTGSSAEGATVNDTAVSEENEVRQEADSLGESSDQGTSSDRRPFLSIFSGPEEDTVKTVPSSNPSWTEAPAAAETGRNTPAANLSDSGENRVSYSNTGDEDAVDTSGSSRVSDSNTGDENAADTSGSSRVSDSNTGDEDAADTSGSSRQTPEESFPEDITGSALFRGSFLIPEPPGFSSFMGGLLTDGSDEKETAVSEESVVEEQNSESDSDEEQETEKDSAEGQAVSEESVVEEQTGESDSDKERESIDYSIEERETEEDSVEEQAASKESADEEQTGESDSGDDSDLFKDTISSEDLISGEDEFISVNDLDELPIYALADPFTSGRLYYRYGRRSLSDSDEKEEAETQSEENRAGNTAAPTQRRTVFIGDSRTVGMEMFVGGTENEFWSAKNSMGYSWMVNSGVPGMEKLIDENTDVVILMGVNDLGNVYRYVDYMNEKGAEWKARGARTFFVSVTPVLDSKSPNAKNSRIEDFNAYAISNLKDVYYIDAYNRIRDHFGSPDGIHYDTATYREIYRIIHFYLYRGWYEEAGLHFYFDCGRPVTGWHFLEGEWQYMDGTGVRWIKNGRVGDICLAPYPMTGMMDPDAAILTQMYRNGTGVH